MRFRALFKGKALRGQSSETRAPRKAPAVTAFWFRGLLGTGLVVLFAFAVAFFAWMEGEEAVGLHQLEGCSAMIARDVEKRVAALQGRLRALGSDPRMRRAFRVQSQDELRAEAESLAHLWPDASRLRLVKLGVGGSEDMPTEPLSYAGLDLVQQAKHGRSFTLLEVHRLGSPEEHLAIAAPVFDEENKGVLGVVHITLPMSLLPAVEDAGGNSGRLSFQQRVEEKDVTLKSAAGAETPSGGPDHQVPIQGTSLHVAAWVGADSFDEAFALWAFVAYLVLMTLIALVLWFPLRGLRRALVLDYGSVVALVEDALNRKSPRPLQCRLAETKPVIKVLTGLLGRLQPARQPLQKASSDKSQRVPKQEKAASGPASKEHRDDSHVAIDEIAAEGVAETTPVRQIESVPPQIFRAYDIRGIVDRELTADLFGTIGLAVGTEAKEAGDQTVIVGRDTRPSSKALSQSLVVGLRESGRDVLDLGVVPTPLIYFATRYQGQTSGAMVTASHNPENYNGLKLVVAGVNLAEERIKGLRERIAAGSFSRGDGQYRVGDLISDYVGHAEKDVAIARTLKVVIDCGNGAAAVVAPRLYSALGCELVELDCDPDAGFPDGRVPDPTRLECLEALQFAVVTQGADLGLAFDADGDRLGIVDSSGKVIWADRVLMLLAADVLSRHPGTDVIFDVKSSHHLASEILRHGGRPVMWRTGYAPLRAKLQETGALLAGEWSGHIIFRDRWFGFDDALYAGARLLEVLALDPRPSAEVFAALPEAISTPELSLPLAEGEAAHIMTAVLAQIGQLQGLDLYTEDGLRVESDKGWGLVRASNTRPALVFRFEADDEAGLSQIQDLFRRMMERAAPALQLPF